MQAYGFRNCFTPLRGVLFTFPSRYSYAIGLSRVFSLAGWTRRIHAGLHVSRATQGTAMLRLASCKGLSPAVAGLSRPFHSQDSCNHAALLPPGGRNLRGLGCAPFARHYWGYHCCFLFLRVLRCFSSPGSPPHHADTMPSAWWVVPFGNPRIKGHLRLPAAYRSLSRPSSPVRAQASTVCPDFLFAIMTAAPKKGGHHGSVYCLSRSTSRRIQYIYIICRAARVKLYSCLLQHVKDRYIVHRPRSSRKGGTVPSCTRRHVSAVFPMSRRALSRKEVFQPHLPVRLPCYDLAPITGFALGRSSRRRTSGAPGFHGLTGGVYKARERIHRAMADARLLANPASRSRVADSGPNWEGIS